MHRAAVTGNGHRARLRPDALIGVIVSLFSAITVTRTLLYLLVDAGIGNNPALFGLNVRSVGGQTAAGDTQATRAQSEYHRPSHASFTPSAP